MSPSNSWVFSPLAARSIAQSTKRLNLWDGAVRSGKTVSSIIAWILYVQEAPPGDLLMVGKTERTLKRNILDVIETIVGVRNYKLNQGEGVLWLFGRRIYLAGANDERAEGKIRGMTCAGAYGDELTLWPESFFKQLLARMSVRGARLFGTTNPDGPYHWLKVGYLDRAAELGVARFQFGLADNPALDPEYVRSLKLEYQPGTLWYKRFIDGLWVAAEGAVYDMWDESIHVLDKLPEVEPELYVSIDYGTSNATAAGLMGRWKTPQAGGLKAALLRSYYHSGRDSGRQKTDAQYRQDIDKWLGDDKKRVKYAIVDPSAASFIAEMRAGGYRVVPADNDVLNGIRTQAKMLQNGEYKIGPDPSNAPYIRDYGAYLWDSRAQKRGEDKPLQQHDHTKDSERYYLQTMFGGTQVGMRRY